MEHRHVFLIKIGENRKIVVDFEKCLKRIFVSLVKQLKIRWVIFIYVSEYRTA